MANIFMMNVEIARGMVCFFHQKSTSTSFNIITTKLKAQKTAESWSHLQRPFTATQTTWTPSSDEKSSSNDSGIDLKKLFPRWRKCIKSCTRTLRLNFVDYLFRQKKVKKVVSKFSMSLRPNFLTRSLPVCICLHICTYTIKLN
jgi:hypothetical protein